VKIDWFMIKTYNAQPREQQRRWIKFSSTQRNPSKFGTHTWTGRPPCGNFAWKDSRPRLHCEADAPKGSLQVLQQGPAAAGAAQVVMRRVGVGAVSDMIGLAGGAGGTTGNDLEVRGSPGEDLGVPVSGVGLAYQNLCKVRPELLEAWRR
jgi:hypothetical protein